MGRGRGNGTSRVPFVSPWERAVDAAISRCELGRFDGIENIPLTNLVMISPLHQIDVNMGLMIRICAVA
jgi:hypothetical protein